MVKNIHDTQKGIEILMYLNKSGESYINKISFDLKITFSHVWNLVALLEGWNLITKKKVGRKSILNLTEKGSKIAKKFIEINNILK